MWLWSGDGIFLFLLFHLFSFVFTLISHVLFYLFFYFTFLYTFFHTPFGSFFWFRPSRSGLVVTFRFFYQRIHILSTSPLGARLTLISSRVFWVFKRTRFYIWCANTQGVPWAGIPWRKYVCSYIRPFVVHRSRLYIRVTFSFGGAPEILTLLFTLVSGLFW